MASLSVALSKEDLPPQAALSLAMPGVVVLLLHLVPTPKSKTVFKRMKLTAELLKFAK